jgi:putative membrane protein
VPFLIRVLIQTLAILLITYLAPGLLRITGPLNALAAAFVLGLVNTVLRPLFILLTLPLTLMTFGLFLLVINALMLMLASALVPGFYVSGFFGALFGSVLISLTTWILTIMVDRGSSRLRS